ncbi:hypothetical protein [Aminivibrio sp.]|uniref:hypothetical protein n=1 Tax=Aminivibrio sp. TaxID=1872489 RepID=UPI001A6265C5|nr:hypothetical protein [Aminivibrio sp.]MBL3540013.1 hypothetical protein [Aminivibrio sp.]
MKNTFAVLIVLAVLLCIVPAGADAGLPGGPVPDMEREETPEGITFITAYSARGSRSEARHHYIEIEGFLVPDVFSRLKYKDFPFEFISRQNHWGDDGYVLAGELVVPESPSAVAEEQLEKGWYEGPERLSGTPGNWVWGTWEGGSLFAAPEKLAEAAKELKLPLLPRDGSPFQELILPRPVEKER